MLPYSFLSTILLLIVSVLYASLTPQQIRDGDYASLSHCFSTYGLGYQYCQLMSKNLVYTFCASIGLSFLIIALDIHRTNIMIVFKRRYHLLSMFISLLFLINLIVIMYVFQYYSYFALPYYPADLRAFQTNINNGDKLLFSIEEIGKSYKSQAGLLQRVVDTGIIHTCGWFLAFGILILLIPTFGEYYMMYLDRKKLREDEINAEEKDPLVQV